MMPTMIADDLTIIGVFVCTAKLVGLAVPYAVPIELDGGAAAGL
jgi:hypothetical protein